MLLQECDKIILFLSLWVARHWLFDLNKQQGVPAQPSVMNEICSSLLQSYWKLSFKVHFHSNPSFSYENLDQCRTSVHLWRITSPPPFPPFSPAVIRGLYLSSSNSRQTWPTLALYSAEIRSSSPWKLEPLLESFLTEIEPSVVTFKRKSRLEKCENTVGD